MYKGIVMSTDSEYAYIFTEKCQLVKVALEPKHLIGSEVSLSVEQVEAAAEYSEERSDTRSVREFLPENRIYENVTGKRKTRYFFRTAAVAATLVLVMLTAFFAVRNMRPAAVFATVSVDINPSLNLDINRNLEVLDAVALDGQTAGILEEVDLTGMSLQEAVVRWVNYLAEEKNIKSEDILIAGVINRQNTSLAQQLTKLESDLANQIAIEEQVRIRVIFSYDKKLEDRAYNNNLSIGRQLIYENSIGSDSELNHDNAAQNRIGQMIDEFVEKGDHDWTKGRKTNASITASTFSETTSQENAPATTNNCDNSSSESYATSRQTQQSGNPETQGTTQRFTEQNQLKPTADGYPTSPEPQQNSSDNQMNTTGNNLSENTAVETNLSRSAARSQLTE